MGDGGIFSKISKVVTGGCTGHVPNQSLAAVIET